MEEARNVTKAELRAHRSLSDGLWLAVDGVVYDVTKFAALHPGGSKLLESLGGTDASDEFHALHRSSILRKYERLAVGKLSAEKGAHEQDIGCFSPVPFSEILGLSDFSSAYFSQEHKAFTLRVRKFIDAELAPIAESSSLRGDYPSRELRKRLAMGGLYAARLGPGPWMKHCKDLGIGLFGIAHRDYDHFYEMIVHQEVSRLGYPGFVDSLGAGYMISVPTIFNFGPEWMIQSYGRELLVGNKHSVLAVSEPFAGSDVASLRTTAELVHDPDTGEEYYVVNGVKKWITEGAYADLFVAAVRTGGPSKNGISLLLIERGEGVETRQIKTTYSTAAGTALVIFHDCRVPARNILGERNAGFGLIMRNFNHERWFIVQQVLGGARAAVTDAFLWATQRTVFRKKLIDRPCSLLRACDALVSLRGVHHAQLPRAAAQSP